MLVVVAEVVLKVEVRLDLAVEELELPVVLLSHLKMEQQTLVVVLVVEVIILLEVVVQEL